MVKTLEETRQQQRQQYHNLYPPGFKRRRNAEQTALQRAAQRNYDRRRGKAPARVLQKKVRNFLNGTCEQGAELVGCTREELQQHLEQGLAGNVFEWKLSYIKHPREFDLTDDEQCKLCFHYTNLRALPTKSCATAFAAL
jgi:hypothetical protein